MAYAKKDYAAATQYFAEAIELKPSNHVYYSNRSASFAAMGRFVEAKADGEQCVAIDPTFAKGKPFLRRLHSASFVHGQSLPFSQVTTARRPPNFSWGSWRRRL